MNLRHAAALAFGAALFAACASDRTLSPVPRRQSSAQTLGIVSTELEDDARAQAVAALARDARRREARFREVAEPGFLFRSTRVPQREIDAGLWSATELFELGGQLFHQRFRKEDGYGGADTPAFGRFQRGERGGPDANQCADCHRRGGIAGAGDTSDNTYPYGDGEDPESGLERNPISLVGVGYLELLAREMSAELAATRASLLAQAKATGAVAQAELKSKGISFGTFSVRPNGTVDASGLQGVSPDLVVRPFGWKGHTASIREMVESELASHHGMQSDDFVAHATVAKKGASPLPDPDGDGVVSEITEGQVTALTAYLAMQEVPATEPPVLLHEQTTLNVDIMTFWSEGAARFRTIGCATCHVPELPLDSSVYTLASRDGGSLLAIDLVKEGAAPRQALDEKGRVMIRAFTDLKRHDMGVAMADAFSEQGIEPATFLTPPLWGVARSRPYMHDGRAPTLEDAIALHGGEAQAAHDAYMALTDKEKGGIRVYLMSLTRARRFAVP